MNGKVGCRFLFYIAFENFKMKIFTMKNQGIKQMMGGGPKKAKNPKIQQKKPNSGISGHFGSALQNLNFFSFPTHFHFTISPEPPPTSQFTCTSDCWSPLTCSKLATDTPATLSSKPTTVSRGS